MSRRLVACACALLLAAACGNLAEVTAAEVHGRPISASEINDALTRYEASPEYRRLADQGDPGSFSRRFEQSYLSQLIRRGVFDMAAEGLGVDVTVIDVHERIEEIKGNYPNEEAFEEDLEEKGINEDQIDLLVRDALVEERLRAEVVADAGATEDELRAAYENDPERFAETRARHILLEDAAAAAAVQARLEAASEDEVDDLFARLARTRSTDPQSKDNGGDLGYLTRSDPLPDVFQSALEDLEVGEISAPVQTEFGYHVIQVTDRRVRSFERVRDRIDQELSTPLQDQAWQEWVVDRYRAAAIAVNPRYGELDIATQQVVDAGPGSVPGTVDPPAQSPPPGPPQPGGQP
ncbi:MAG: peptidylprolyl isomerase [Actinomycetota bacterium]